MFAEQQEIVKVPESTAIVRFQDCDPFGHLNNARYFDYFFNARNDHLMQYYGFSIFEWGKLHTQSWVVTQNQIAYLRPAMLDETVAIQTQLIHYSETQIVVEGLMWDKLKKRVKAVLWAEFTYVSMASGRTEKHPDTLRTFMTSILIEKSPFAEGFAPRVAALKQAARVEKIGGPVVS
jgi:acyl-CoA thioester hydrolase